MTGYMYILECFDMTYYVGSTKNLEKRVEEHQNGEGANYTKRRLPLKLLYYEEYDRIDIAFQREKQVQGWSRLKKEALINGNYEDLPKLAECKNISQLAYRSWVITLSCIPAIYFVHSWLSEFGFKSQNCLCLRCSFFFGIA